MDPPTKPWERVLPLLKDENTIWQEIRNGGPAAGDQPPPIPPRPDDSALNRSYMGIPSQSYGGLGAFGSYGSPFSMYGSGYSGYGCSLPGYSRFGMSGYGGGYGQPNDNDFVRMAEESSRQAFQSIESIVQAFASVSMMLESTYFAVHSSFRAVLGVADHFSRLKGQMTQMFSALAVIKYLNWFIRRILYLLSLSENDPNEEDAWRRSSSSTNGFLTPESVVESLTKPERKKSSWPILIFFSVVFGTPWLIWKLLTSLTGGSDNEANKKWMSKEGDHYIATGLYTFTTNNPREVSFEANQELVIAPKELQPRVKGWLLASSDGRRCGLVPAAYIKILAFKTTSFRNGNPKNESVKDLQSEKPEQQ